ncbi:putative tryptophan N-monooxygenase [Helianthus anomalus]
MTTMLLARMLQGYIREAPGNEGSVEFVENHDDICMAKPLMATDKPGLPLYMYPTY